MAVAKRQRKEKPLKMEEKKIQEPEWELQVQKKSPSWLAQFT